MRNPIQLSQEALGILTANIRLFAGILLIPAVLSFIGALLAPTQAEMMVGISFSPAYIVMMLLSAIVNIFMSIALVLVMQNRSLTAKEAYQQSTPFFWRYVGMSIIMSILLLIGFLLLIIPGIILMVWLAFSMFVLVLERGGVVESLKKSREYVRGRWWAVFGRLVVMTIIVILVSVVLSTLASLIPSVAVSGAILSALSLILAPFAIAYTYLMYQELKGGTVPAPEAPVLQ